MSDQPSCLIIGGGGFVGSGIQSAARARGWRVLIADRSTYDSFVSQSFDIVINANGNAQRFHADRDPLFDFEASVASVYRSLLDFSCTQYALVSTVDVYNHPDRPEFTHEQAQIDPLSLGTYAFHKWTAEQIVMRQETPWQVFRLAQMVGKGLRKGPVFDLLNGQPVWIHDESRLHFMNTRNVGEVICTLIEEAPIDQVYNVCGRGSVEFRSVLSLFPGSDGVTRASSERQCYDIDTSRTHQITALPNSWEEVQAFVEQSLRDHPV